MTRTSNFAVSDGSYFPIGTLIYIDCSVNHLMMCQVDGLTLIKSNHGNIIMHSIDIPEPPMDEPDLPLCEDF